MARSTGTTGASASASHMAQHNPRRPMSEHDPLPEFDLYGELGVEPDADRATIERAWRAAVAAAHPDRAGPDDGRAATDQTARLNIARDWLVDPVRRQRYDSLRRPSPDIPLPTVNPMGSWPSRPSATRRHLSLVNRLPVAVGVMAMVLTLLVGVGSNVVTIVLFDLGAVTLAYYSILALVGAAYRRSRN